MTRRGARLALAAAIVAGAFLLAAGVPLAVVWLLSQLGLPLVAAVMLGVLLAGAGIGGLALALARIERVYDRLAPPPPPGVEPGSVLLEASLVVAVLASLVAAAAWLLS